MVCSSQDVVTLTLQHCTGVVTPCLETLPTEHGESVELTHQHHLLSELRRRGRSPPSGRGRRRAAPQCPPPRGSAQQQSCRRSAPLAPGRAEGSTQTSVVFCPCKGRQSSAPPQSCRRSGPLVPDAQNMVVRHLWLCVDLRVRKKVGLLTTQHGVKAAGAQPL